MRDWIFYSIYVPNFNYLENALKEIIQPVVDKVNKEVSVQRWFFIRYVDMQGPHIRLRFLVEDEDLDKIEDLIETFADEALADVLSRPHSPMPRLLRLPEQGVEFEGAVELEEYEPEYEKYGGVRGVQIAERCFEASSEMVLQLIQHDQIDRFNVALLLMKETSARAGLSSAEQTRLWEDVLEHWSGATYYQDNTFKDNLNKAAQKRSDIVMKNLEETSKNPVVLDLIEHYTHELGQAFQEIRQSDTIQVTIPHLAFHYIHMTNNRIGVTPIEEGYLGALLLNASRVQNA